MQSRSTDERFANIRRTAFRALGPALAALVIALPLVPTPSTAHDKELKDRPGMGKAVAADAIAQNPQEYDGEKLLVVGYVDDIFGPRVFDIQKQPTFSQTMVGTNRSGAGQHGPDLLVYVPEGVALTGTIGKHKEVQLVGRVQRGLQVDRSVVAVGDAEDLATRPVIVAEVCEVE